MAYTRVKSVKVNRRATHYRYNLGDAVGPVQFLGGYTLLNRTRTGDRLPGWRDVIANRDNATTPMSGVAEHYNSDLGRWKLSFWDNRYPVGAQRDELELVGDIPGFTMYVVDWPATLSFITANQRATISFYKAVRAAQVKFQGQVFLGELRETLKMMKRPASALRDGLERYLQDVKKIRKNRFGRLKREELGNSRRFSEAIAGTWLEHSFGWVPLFHDVADFADAFFDQITARRGQVALVRGFGKEEITIKNKTEDRYGYSLATGGRGGQIYSTYAIRSTESAIVSIKGLVKARVESPSRNNLRRFGFSPEEFIPAAWELLPWSFLIDYFSNVGDVLEASVTDMSTVAWVNKSEVLLRKKVMTVNPDIDAMQSHLGSRFISWQGVGPLNAQHTARTVTRLAYAGIDTPTLTFELPKGVKQVANMAALAVLANSVYPQHHRR